MERSSCAGGHLRPRPNRDCCEQLVAQTGALLGRFEPKCEALKRLTQLSLPFPRRFVDKPPKKCLGIAKKRDIVFMRSTVMESDHRSGAPETAKTTFPSPRVQCPCGEIRDSPSGGGGPRKRETPGAFCNLAGRLGSKSSERRVGEPRPCPAATEGRGVRAV